MNTKAQQIAEKFFDESIRLGSLIWVPGQTDQYGENVKEFFEDVEEASDLTEILGFPISEETASELWNGDDDEIGEIWSKLFRAGRLGFIVKAETPWPFNFTEGGYSSGFGHYTSKWFYTEALDEAFVDRLIAWKESIVERARQKEAKSSKPI